ncbi:MAG: hypothetical protein QOD76_1304, partial [Solirubrobacteraceae bacterium]|nr:hypothetical protein [Solirubrobacteraceae bacterium]
MEGRTEYGGKRQQAFRSGGVSDPGVAFLLVR